MSQRSRPFAALAVLAAVGPTACSSPQAHDDPGVVLPAFSDVVAAPAPIQAAARAVVRVATAGSVATGSFVSESGLLLTNNHVLGADVCPREGCWIQVTFLHQRGEAPRAPQTVFAVPVAVDVGLDAAFAQLYTTQGGPQLATPDHLTIRPETPAALLDLHVTVVGHPEGRLKKWTDGVVAYWSGSWFESTAYVLPGSSGSPVLDDDGRIVGIVHRGATGEDLFTGGGANVYSLGTASAALLAARDAPLPDVMLSATSATTASEAVANARVYLNGRTATVTVAGAPTSVLTLLGAACDEALARDDFASPDELDAALAPCGAAIPWIECRADASPVPHVVVCPDAVERDRWSVRYQAMNARSRRMNGILDLYPISFGLARLSSTTSAGDAAAASALEAALAQARPELDFTLANYLAAFRVSRYAGQDVAARVAGYAAAPHYELQAASLVSAAAWLHQHGDLPRPQLLGILSALAADPRVAVGAKLYVEEVQYALRAL